jgi:hypothetical protein
MLVAVGVVLFLSSGAHTTGRPNGRHGSVCKVIAIYFIFSFKNKPLHRNFRFSGTRLDLAVSGCAKRWPVSVSRSVIADLGARCLLGECPVWTLSPDCRRICQALVGSKYIYIHVALGYCRSRSGKPGANAFWPSGR